jgi:cation diffusion facilitator family transporter
MTSPRQRYLILLAILAAVVTLVLKGVAYRLTGSVGLLSEVVESGVNLLAALTAFASLWYASRPIDPSHTYGHEKIEYFSSGLEGVLIVGAAVGIAWYAGRRLLHPESLRRLDVGVYLTAGATVINLLVALALIRVGRTQNSIILEADGRHIMADVMTSVGVIVGLGLVWLTGLHWLDPLLGLGLAFYIVWTGLDLIWRSFNGLMDHALPLEEQTAVRAAIEAKLERGMDYHALRTRRAGSRRFADFHLLVPGALSVRKAHELTSRIEDAIRAALPGIEITVHIEPIEDKSAWEDSALVPLEQAARRAQGETPRP